MTLKKKLNPRKTLEEVTELFKEQGQSLCLKDPRQNQYYSPPNFSKVTGPYDAGQPNEIWIGHYGSKRLAICIDSTNHAWASHTMIPGLEPTARFFIGQQCEVRRHSGDLRGFRRDCMSAHREFDGRR